MEGVVLNNMRLVLEMTPRVIVVLVKFCFSVVDCCRKLTRNWFDKKLGRLRGIEVSSIQRLLIHQTRKMWGPTARDFITWSEYEDLTTCICWEPTVRDLTIWVSSFAIYLAVLVSAVGGSAYRGRAMLYGEDFSEAAFSRRTVQFPLRDGSAAATHRGVIVRGELLHRLDKRLQTGSWFCVHTFIWDVQTIGRFEGVRGSGRVSNSWSTIESQIYKATRCFGRST